ncbi:SymE family type I addiction module toxin [Pantoea sp. FN0305]|uniref:SymE family type I addiction module toxin n=1 Tax=Pantoea sp. FN0305 TaxID=3418559 RepID=UPI003CF63DBC
MGYISRRHATRSGEFLYYSQSPGLHLKGDWLAEMGFETEQKVDVTSQPGQLVIRLAEEG